ncbi:FHA domain-containing protein [Agromyces sp. SYSU K20354]|uniref:FHA domain-containing protein n=1 Tax=Agromyces cavernae TaxID=2898659 RepID=UPI001E5CE77A|nr:FHA domain-containing protein [Agromyces cavernae]MCD2442494.1 FHA domain-containing protein [Agromyces cavernae]
MVAPDFIVPPPGLIPNAPEPAAPPSTTTEPERTVRAPARVLPTFTPVPAGPPVPAPAASASPGPFRLSGPGGFEVLLTVPIVIGRDPVAAGAHADARPISVIDPARSVSKTHAVLDARTGVVTVIDLHSTNGVRVQPPSGEIIDPAPGTPTEVAAGSTLFLGELGLRVDRLSIDTV